VIPLLWRAQEQEGWLSRPAIEYVADLLGMPYIRALEVATFYFMFQLAPVGTLAHVQICGTTSCMICGGEELVKVCREKIANDPFTLSPDGRFSWEEVECLGACANAPMALIGKDYYEDLTAEDLARILDELAAGGLPRPGSAKGRYASEPVTGLTSLTAHETPHDPHNASVSRALAQGDTVKRIDGTEVPNLTPWLGKTAPPKVAAPPRKVRNSPPQAQPAPAETPVVAAKTAAADPSAEAPAGHSTRPEALAAPRGTGADDLRKIKGVGPKIEVLLNSLGIYHFDQVASWTEAELAWIDDNLEGFKGRASRDDWIAQARLLAAGIETDFSSRVDQGDVY